MAETSSVVDRADVLMRRRRSFVASKNEAPPPESKVEAPVEEESTDDIPVLTEVVVAETGVTEEKAELPEDTQEHLLASDIARAIGDQLTRDLPDLLETVLLNAGEDQDRLLDQLLPQPQSGAPAAKGQVDLRTYGVGAQILREVGVRKMELLGQPRRMPSMTGYDLEITGYIPKD